LRGLLVETNCAFFFIPIAIPKNIIVMSEFVVVATCSFMIEEIYLVISKKRGSRSLVFWIIRE